jgi:hypothetical protein
VEPGRDKDIRFQFTLPHSSIKTDYVLFNAGGRGLAIPRYSMDAVVGLDQVVINGEFKDRYMELDDARIPVYRFDELAHEEMSGGGDGGNLMIVGIAEKRIGFFLDEQGGRTVGIQDQLTEENWASLTRHMLHLGEKEYPVLDVRLMLKKVDYLRELDGSPDESGCIVSGSGFLEREKELTVPRV